MTTVTENREQVLAHLKDVLAFLHEHLDAGTLRVITMTIGVDTGRDGAQDVQVRHWIEGTGVDALRASRAFQAFIYRVGDGTDDTKGDEPEPVSPAH